MFYVFIEFNKNGYDLTDIFNIIMITDKKDIILDTLKDYITKILFDNDKLTFKKSKYNDHNTFGYDLYEKNIYKKSFLIIEK